MEKYQFKFRPEPQLGERLDRLAAKCGYSSAQQFVVAALDEYAELLADLLLEARDQHELLKKRQRFQLLSRSSNDSGGSPLK